MNTKKTNPTTKSKTSTANTNSINSGKIEAVAKEAEAVISKAAEAAELVASKAVKAAKATDAVKTKAVKAIESVPQNITKENIEKNLNEIKEVATTVPKATTKKVKEVSTTAKKTISKKSEEIIDSVKKSIPKAKPIEKTIYIQYFGKEVSEQTLIQKFNEEWTKEHKLNEVESLKIYYKIEENTAHYLVNDSITISISFF
jgi:hypothetical protein